MKKFLISFISVLAFATVVKAQYLDDEKGPIYTDEDNVTLDSQASEFQTTMNWDFAPPHHPGNHPPPPPHHGHPGYPPPHDHPGYPPPHYPHNEYVNCDSRGYQYSECYAGGYIRRAGVSRQNSRSSCDYGSSWGIVGDRIWVNNGCRATFWVELD